MSGRKRTSEEIKFPPTRENKQLWALLYLAHASLNEVHSTTGISLYRLKKLLKGYTPTEDETDVLTSQLHLLHSASQFPPNSDVIATELILMRRYSKAKQQLIKFYRDHPPNTPSIHKYIRDHCHHLRASTLRDRLRKMGFENEQISDALKDLNMVLVQRQGQTRYGVPNWHNSIKWLVDNLPPHTPTLLQELTEQSPFALSTLKRSTGIHPHFSYNHKTKEITYEPPT